MPNWAINTNVQTNRTEKINKINICITHNFGYCIIPFKFSYAVEMQNNVGYL